MPVRVRFAPSPTGLLHVGALRTVLYDYLLRQKEGGSCILRIEDTDRSRYNPDSEHEFVETLRWVGIEFDEGPHLEGGPHAPYRQSERQALGIYASKIAELEANGHAYKAFDTTEEIEQMREFQQINKVQIGYYGGDWRNADAAKVEAAIAEGKPYVIRLKVPRDRKIVVQDLIRGRVEFDSNTLPDPVLIKADGMPTYHFAAMVDDHLMEITHVLRGEEWISTSPIHWLIFEAFGWTPPIFVHCPVIVGADGKKLSKRHGATRVLDYMAQGYLKSALKNFIALIGWSPGDDREAMSEQELIQAFSLSGLQPSPGKFDMEKLKWLNGHTIRSMAAEQVLAEIEGLYAEEHTKGFWENFVDEEVLPNQTPRDGKAIYERFEKFVLFARTNREYALQCIKLEQERVTNLIEFGEACEFFIVEEPTMDPKAVEKWFKPSDSKNVLLLLREGIVRLRSMIEPNVPECEQSVYDATFELVQKSQFLLPLPDGNLTEYVRLCSEAALQEDVASIKAFTSDPETLRQLAIEVQKSLGIEKLGPIVHPTRVALTGKTFGPGLFELMSVLGPDRIVKRIDRALSML